MASHWHQPIDLGFPTARWRWLVPAGGLLFCACASTTQPPRLWPCPFRLLTGLACPLCGMTRAMIFLGHGQVGLALAYNALSPLVAVLLVGWLLRDGLSWLRQRPPDRFASPRWLLYGLTALSLVYGALRWTAILKEPPR